jgi:hypothetical protein
LERDLEQDWVIVDIVRHRVIGKRLRLLDGTPGVELAKPFVFLVE